MTEASTASPLRPRFPRPTPRDGLAGLSVALILVPQAIAYAVLAGMPAEAGLAVAAVATIAAAPFVSSPYLMTGPVAITALLSFGVLEQLATPETADYVALAGLLAVLVGVVRLAVGASRTGVLAYLLSDPVLAGFTPAAALVIAISQLPAVAGLRVDGRGPSDILPAVADLTSWDLHTVALAAVTGVVLLVTRHVHALFPTVLAAVVSGSVLARVTGYDGALVGDVPGGLPFLQLDLPWGSVPDLLVGAAVIALVGFAEPAAIARAYARETRTRWDADREFVSQGVANIAAGLGGGFPVGGSFSRSAVARTAGAETAWTGAASGLLVLAAAPFVGLVEQLPRAVLASVIIVSVARLARPRELLTLRRLSRQQFLIAGVTYVSSLLLAPQVQWGVLLGVALAVGAHLRRELSVAAPAWLEERVLHVRPLGVLFFGSAHRLGEQLDDLIAQHAEVDHVVLHMDRLGRVDVTGATALRAVCEDLHRGGITTAIVDLTPTGRKIVDRVLDADQYGVDLAAPPATARMPGTLGDRDD